MLKLLRSKIEAITFNGQKSLSELMKLLGIAIFALDDESRGQTPPYKECLTAIAEMKEIATKQRLGSTEQGFNSLKNDMLNILNKVIAFFSENSLNSPSLMEMITGGGEVRKNQENEIKFALLMVEQNHIDFFNKRTSHLPSQPHDRFNSHYWIRTQNNIATFGFLENSGLPEYIKEEALSVIQETAKKFQ